jgi:hypothetical protein
VHLDPGTQGIVQQAPGERPSTAIAQHDPLTTVLARLGFVAVLRRADHRQPLDARQLDRIAVEVERSRRLRRATGASLRGCVRTSLGLARKPAGVLHAHMLSTSP